MAYSLSKIRMVIAILVITATGLVQGSDCSSISRDYCNCCVPECCCYTCGQFFVEAQMLYLRAFEGGLTNVCDSTQIINSTEGGIPISRLRGKAHDLDFTWNWGLCIGVGYEFADNISDIGVYWTYYNSHSGDENHEHSWHLLFNVVDVLWECPWLTCSPIHPALTLFAGLRCARIDQKLLTNFASTIDGSLTTSTGKIKEEFLGIGPLLGIDGEWGIGCGFSLYGNIAIGILYGTFHVKSNQTSASSTGTNIDHLGNHLQASQLVADAGIGVRWETYFCNYKLLVLQLGLEQHRYFNHNQFCGYGDLSLDGVSLALNVLY